VSLKVRKLLPNINVTTDSTNIVSANRTVVIPVVSHLRVLVSRFFIHKLFVTYMFVQKLSLLLIDEAVNSV
jgi:hypothetical protein